jgi:hypothetical protein
MESKTRKVSSRRAQRAHEISTLAPSRKKDGRVYIERVNAPFLAAGGTAEDFRVGIERAISFGWLWRHGIWDLRAVHRRGRAAVCVKEATE